MWRGLFFSGVFLCLLFAGTATAQTVHQEFQERVTARVLEVVSERESPIMGTGATTTVQELRIELTSGERAGEVVRLENDLVILAPGDRIFVNRLVAIDGSEYVVFKDIERRPQLVYLGVLFVALVMLFAGWQGLRALGSLAISIIAIGAVLVPALLAGYSPVWSSFGIAGVVLGVTLFVTHGFNPRSIIAFIGTFGAVGVTCVLATVTVSQMRLTGFASDAAVYLNFSTGGSLDFAGLLLGSIIIGLLGVLDDVSITQAAVVQELRAANTTLGFGELYRRAIRVGQSHVGSLVNTLALAYIGAALPLVLLFARTESSIWITVNQEVVAAELVRIMVGSIGLILAVPFTTTMAAWYFRNKQVEAHECTAHCGHHH